MAESHSMANPQGSQESDASRSAARSAPSHGRLLAMGLHRSMFLRLLGTYGTIIVLLIMLAAFSIAEPGTFATIGNFRNILNDMAIGTIVAGGLTVPLVAGDFDLSIGYVASFCGLLLVGLLSFNQLPIPIAMLIVVAIGAAIGIINGVIVSKMGVNAFIATLGTGTIVVGLNYAYSGGIPLQLTHSREFTNVAIGRLWGVPHLVLIMAAVLIILWVILNRTVQGQHIKAIGISAEFGATRRNCSRSQSYCRIRLREHLRSHRGRAHGVQPRLGTGDGRRRLHADVLLRGLPRLCCA